MSDPHHTPGTTTDAKSNVLGEIDKPATLYVVWIGILVLFATTVLISQSGALGKYTLFAQLAIGATQASLVAYHFMHLKQGDRVVTLTALSSVFWIGILFVLFMADYMSRHRQMGW
jgi:cytochrome c oxidase subunit 4